MTITEVTKRQFGGGAGGASVAKPRDMKSDWTESFVMKNEGAPSSNSRGEETSIFGGSEKSLTNDCGRF